MQETVHVRRGPGDIFGAREAELWMGRGQLPRLSENWTALTVLGFDTSLQAPPDDVAIDGRIMRRRRRRRRE